MCDSLFICACLLKVYNFVHAFQLYVKHLYYHKGLKPQKANNLFFVNEENTVCAGSSTAVKYCISLPLLSISYHSYLLQISTGPLKYQYKDEMYVQCLSVSNRIHFCAYGTDVQLSF